MYNSIEPWKLTAYALSELDAEETQQVCDAIEADPALQVQLQEIQSVIARVQSAIQHSPTDVDGLTEIQTAVIAEHIQNATRRSIESPAKAVALTNTAPIPTSKPVRLSRTAAWGLIALAASLLVAVLWFPAGMKSQKLAYDIGLMDDFGRSESHVNGMLSDESSIDLSLMPAADKDQDAAAGRPLAQPTNPTGTEGFVVNRGQYFLGDEVQSVPATAGDGDGALRLEMKEEQRLSRSSNPTKDAEFQNGTWSASAPPFNAPGMKGGTNLVYERDARKRFVVPLGKNMNEAMRSITPRIIIPEEEEGKWTSTIKAMPVDRTVRDPESRMYRQEQSGDRYEPIVETPFVTTEQAPLSTFSIDVDTASYSKIRQYLMQANQLPQPNAVRIEELVNYFEYDYEGPTDEHPFASNMAVHTCPWNEDHKLVRLGLQAKKVDVKERAKANLVFLLDVSGSMDEPNKLPLVKQAISMLVRQLGESDRIAMVVYAGAAGCVLPSITGDRQAEILAALNELNAGGSTNGGQGIELAYSIAREHFISGGINRVILCTDGDFNVGTTSNEALVKLVQEQAKSKVFLTCLGFGIGNYNDSMMEQISNQGNGVYGMVDNALEARRLLIEQLSGTLITVAKDVKIQVEFNPEKIASYRLIGYENRKLANEDFNNDKKDAGEIGAGHRVTALYEIVPVGVVSKEPQIDELRYRAKKKAEPKLGNNASGVTSPPSHSPSPIAPLTEPLTPENGSLDARSQGMDPLADNLKKISDETKSGRADRGSGRSLENEATEFSNEWLTLKLRYKEPEGDVSSKVEFFLTDEAAKNAADDIDFRWSSAVAEFGLLLRRSQLAPQADWGRMIERARSSTGDNSYRIECLEMMTKARSLIGR